MVKGDLMKGKVAYLIFLMAMVLLGCAKKQVLLPPSPLPPSQEGTKKETPLVPSGKEAEETLRPVKYPGIEGEVWRTPLLKTIYFDFDRYDLRPDAKKTLEENAEVLKANPTWKVLIEGHCDERGSNEYNLVLGEKRARSAMEYLIKLGIDPNRLSIVSYGEERPADPGHNEEAWAKNRRCEFVVVEK